ncbi:MAG: tyrosine phosphatase family protein [Hyphomicrobiales bacterium]
MIIVCPLNKVDHVVEAHGASHVASLLGDHGEMPDFSHMAAVSHLKLAFNDISTPREGYVLPGHEHVDALLQFIHDWDRSSPMVIHCWAGISRSTAGAYITKCFLDPDRNELELARELRSASPSATPNARMVALADEVLERGGRMEEAIASIGRGASAWEGEVFTLSATG